jgi:magnesium chelatase family protein
MLARVMSCATVGLEGAVVAVEVDIAPGMPTFTIVGLPDTAVQESRQRVRAAIRNSGGAFPLKRVTVNLAPADLKKAGPMYDLPIAVGVLLSSEQVSADMTHVLLLGELSLDGSLRHTNGILPMVAMAREAGYTEVIIPEKDAPEAALIEGIHILPFASLAQLIAYFRGEIGAPQFQTEPVANEAPPSLQATDFADIMGQEHAKRAVEVAAAGGHNVLMVGPPGSGKTLLARSLPAILPPMSNSESLEVTRIYSVAGMLPQDTPLLRQRPFRAPHYTISETGLVGGGTIPRPGEITLSHRGVLFLDEMPEFGHAVLELLRQPLEDKTITVSRAQGSATFPANFMMVGAMNPCPCGYYGDPARQCTCAPAAIARYQKRLSGPLLDRIDIFIEVPHVDYDKLTGKRVVESSRTVQNRVIGARERQRQRFDGAAILCNSEMAPRQVKTDCAVEDAAEGLLKAAMKQLYLSARAFHRVLKVARTIADLDGAATIKTQHVAEAVQYRPRRFL